MPQEVKISVIIPVYNVENYLAECLDSVVAQNLDNYEILCIDDGSEDSSGKILDDYANRYPHVQAFHTVNRGLGAARNYGLKRAHGQYVLFVDSDDYIQNNSLRYLYEQASSLDLDILHFDGDIIYEDANLEQQFGKLKSRYALSRSREYSDVTDGQKMYCDMQKGGDHREVSWLQLLRRDFLERNNLLFPEGMLHEDIIFDFACLALAQRVSHRKRNVYMYRIRNSSIITSPISEKTVYSKFRCYLEYSLLAAKLPLRDETAKYAMRMLRGLQRGVKSCYKESGLNIDDCSQYFTPASRAMFKYMIYNPLQSILAQCFLR